MKERRLVGSSLKELSRSRPAATRAAGFELWQVTTGLQPSDWKPSNSIGIGVSEIRVHIGGAWRVIYVAKFAGAVCVLHASGKQPDVQRSPTLSCGEALPGDRGKAEYRITKSSGRVICRPRLPPTRSRC